MFPPSRVLEPTSCSCYVPLVDVDALFPEIGPRLVNFAHQFVVCIGHVVEGEDAPAQLEEEVRAKGYNGPEG